tara:strand:+ start:191 stop:619 length:429 start_codon:yes stop_codon:yes gene_type:complete
MIPVVRIPADFILTEYRDPVWELIIQTISRTKDFVLCFYCDEADDMTAVANFVDSHSDKLRIKTMIKIWDVCRKERVFLDVPNGHVTEARFTVTQSGIEGIIQAMTFLTDHFEFIGRDKTGHPAVKHQKRNDSPNYDSIYKK